MPPPKKATKKAAGHRHDKLYQANDRRRTYEHIGRLEVLPKSLYSLTADSVSELTQLGPKESGKKW